MSMVVPPTATTYVRSRTSGYSNAAGSLPGLTPIAAQLGDWLVWTDGRGRMGGGGGYRWSGWPYGPDGGGPYGPGWTMGRRYQQTHGGALAGQAIAITPRTPPPGTSMPG